VWNKIYRKLSFGLFSVTMGQNNLKMSKKFVKDFQQICKHYSEVDEFEFFKL
jgi:hypothetical protein